MVVDLEVDLDLEWSLAWLLVLVLTTVAIFFQSLPNCCNPCWNKLCSLLLHFPLLFFGIRRARLELYTNLEKVVVCGVRGGEEQNLIAKIFRIDTPNLFDLDRPS